MNKYLCKLCGLEFETDRDPKCDECGANNMYSNDCKLIYLEPKKGDNISVGFRWWDAKKDGDMLKVIQDPRYAHLEDNSCADLEE